MLRCARALACAILVGAGVFAYVSTVKADDYLDTFLWVHGPCDYTYGPPDVTGYELTCGDICEDGGDYIDVDNDNYYACDGYCQDQGYGEEYECWMHSEQTWNLSGQCDLQCFCECAYR